ncbi:MAG TPA: ABC transporter substrate-binding protein [Thermoleophilia bacterium]|nr:ABC transporter substrate-binding protein [Thermoleophilia bacterium]
MRVRSYRRTFITLGVIAILVTGLIWGLAGALAADSGSPTPQSGKVVLQFGWYENIDSLNPFIGYASSAWSVYFENYDTLVNWDAATLQPVPGVAKSWEHSADGTVWTFHLRKDVTFQDGTPLTANDVAFTFNYVVDNDMGNFTTYTNSLKRTTAVDDYTVRMEFSKPKSSVLQMLVPILPEHLWSKISPKAAANSFQNLPPIVGSGPFQVVEWKKDEYCRLVANKKYWGGAPKIDELIYRFYTNQDTMVQDFKQGAIAWANIPEAQFAALQGTPGFGTLKAHNDYFEELGMNCYAGPSKGHPALKDPKFRHALNWAIDRTAIANVAYGGAAIPATGMLPSGYWATPVDYHWEPSADQRYTFDLAKARQELDAAGYTDTNGDGIRDYKGKPITLRLWAVAEKAEYTRAAKLIAGWLREIGLKIQLQTVDDGAASAGMYNMENGVFTPDYDLFVWGWTGDPDPGFLLSVLLTSQINSWSDSAWSNAEYDKLFKQQDSELDPVKRRDIVWRMQQIVYDQTPYLVLVYPLALQAYNTSAWQGWVNQPAPNGTLENQWTYLKLHPATAKSTGGGANWIVAVVVAVVVVAIAVVVLLVRKGRGRPAVEEA